jgi:hypothetical protein
MVSASFDWSIVYIYTRRQLAREHLPHPRCKGINVRCTSELL